MEMGMAYFLGLYLLLRPYAFLYAQVRRNGNKMCNACFERISCNLVFWFRWVNRDSFAVLVDSLFAKKEHYSKQA